MAIGSRLKAVVRNLLHKERAEAELDAEIRAYMDEQADELIATGVEPDEARRRALAEAGCAEPVKQAVRDHRAGASLELLWRDVSYCLRQLRRNPAFAWTAILTLALGIGATTTIFSAVYSLLLRPLPYPEAKQLVTIKPYSAESPTNLMASPDFAAARNGLASFQDVGGYLWRNRNVTGVGDPVRVNWVGVSANFLPMLRVVPQLGRVMRPDEDRRGGPPVVLLSDRFWRSELHADAKVVGKTVILDGIAQTVIGVLPPHFSFPDLALEPDIYGPIDLDRDTTYSVQKPVFGIRVIARLRDGISMEQGQAEVRSFFEQRAKTLPSWVGMMPHNQVIQVTPLQQDLTGANRGPLLIVFGAVVGLLLISCVNVANLQLARAVSRRHETAVRNALGASRGRLIRQLMLESFVLSMLAAALGSAIAFAITLLIRRANRPEALAGAQTWHFAQALHLPFGKLSGLIQVNGWVVLFAIGIAILTTFLFGLAPALFTTRVDLRGSLQLSGMRISSGREQRGTRHVLLILEVGLTVMLLSGSGMLIRSFVNVLRYDAGFNPNNTMTARTLLDGTRYSSGERIQLFTDRLLARLKAIPGVQSAALASALPLGPTYTNVFSFGDDPNPPIPARRFATLITVTPDYFRAVGTSLIAGRAFTDTDTATSPLVAIVNRAFARRYFNGDAIGKHFRIGRVVDRLPSMMRTTVVGVVEDVRHDGLEQEVQPEIYVAMAQMTVTDIHIIVRGVDSASFAEPMRQALLTVDSQQPLFDVESLDEKVADAVSQRRTIMVLITAFALLGLVLSGVGVYGVFAYSVSQRTQEMGIRLALGASRTRLFRLVVGQAATLILIGSALGIGSALWAGRFLSSVLVGISPHDAISLLIAWSLMTGLALMGSFIPAANAATTDLNTVLRSE
ncbi:MAG TPA: ABC transporter permease [Terracidiphilus sp.]|nr:ABC transporter permease [Bryobacteraceae bacterium]HUA99932.1 ABC transporter permease [Terracidiphilus sp.]